MTCPLCDGTGFVIVTRKGIEAAKPCECRDAAVAADESRRQEPGTPLTVDLAMPIVTGLCDCLEFSPPPGPGRAVIASLAAKMCSTQEQLQWLVGRTVELYAKWPGIPALRQILCTRFVPRDGIECFSSETYPDGIPAGPQLVQQRLLLPEGHIASVDREADHAIEELVARQTRELPQLSPAEELARRKFDEVLKEAITAPEDRQPPPPPPPGLIAQERAVLEDPAASPQRKEIAREILKSVGIVLQGLAKMSLA